MNPCRGKAEYPIDTDRPRRFVKAHQVSAGDADVLYDIPRLLGGGDIANLGHRSGGSAFIMALSLQDNRLPGTVLSVDVRTNPEWTDDLERRNKTELGDRVRLALMTSHDLGELCRRADDTFKFVFVDADHSYEGVLDDIKTWSPLVEAGGMIAFHDCISVPIHKAIEETLVPSPDWKERKDLHINKIRV